MTEPRSATPTPAPAAAQHTPPTVPGELHQLWAKSPRPSASAGTAGELLTVHSRATLDALRSVRRRVGRLPLLPAEFWPAAAWAALLHDAGKVATGFQRQVGNGGVPEPWRQRHEVLSLGFLPTLLRDQPETLRRLVAAGIATHHRALHSDGTRHRKEPVATLYRGLSATELQEEFGPVDAQALTDLIAWFATTATQAGLRTERQADKPVALNPDELVAATHTELGFLLAHWNRVDPAEGLLAVLLQGAVTMADHLSSAHGTLYLTQPLGQRYHSTLTARLARRNSALRPHQTTAAAVLGHLLLRSPTGSGKTEAALLWAAANVDDIRARTGGEPRLFYTLPYLASINAMAGRLGGEVGDSEAVGVSHSRAASYHLSHSVGDDESAGERTRKAVSRAQATKLFREPIRVGTPYQLLRGALAGSIHSGIILDSANSVFVLDELHAYDPRRLGMILAALEFWVRLGGRVAVLSATLPDKLVHFVNEALGLPIDRRPIEPPGEGWPTRHRLRLATDHLTAPGTLDTIRVKLRSGQSVLVVANNVRDAQTIYGALAEETWALYGPQGCLLLHSRFRRLDRAVTERTILDRYGTGRPHQAGLLVATQTVEVSLDVDFDTLHTSGAVLEPLLQRFGRVNRTASRSAPADVVVHPPEYVARRNEEWADGVYPAEPTRRTWSILADHDGNAINERAAVDWLDQIYAGDWGERWTNEVAEHRDRFRDTFLTFERPFVDREGLSAEFDTLFDGTEAILANDVPSYLDALADAGRVAADEYLIPLPSFAATASRWNRELKVLVIDADYSAELGLGEIDRTGKPNYRAGEVY